MQLLFATEMTHAMRFFATLCLASLLTIQLGTAQNIDPLYDPVSFDYMLLGAIRGEKKIDAYSVWTMPLSTMKKYIQSDPSSDFARYIGRYYEPLLRDTNRDSLNFADVDDRFRLLNYVDSNVRFMGDGGFMLRTGTYSRAEGDVNDRFVLSRLSARGMGRIGSNLSFLVDLSDGTRHMGDFRNVRETDPFLKTSFKFNNQFNDEAQKFFNRYYGYIQAEFDFARIRFGRERLQMGFSPIDNMIHNQNAAALDGIVLDVPYKWLRFTSTHGLAEGTDQFGVAVLNKYVASHRVAITPSSSFSLGVYDMIVYSGRGLDFAYLNPVAFYVSAGLGTAQKSETDNSLLGMDLAWRPFDGLMLYGSLIADDINFSTIFDTSVAGNTNKYAFQAGVSWSPTIAGRPALATVEYTRVNPFTYSHRSVVNSWTTLDTPLGWQGDPNSDRLTLQTRYWFAPRITLTLTADYTRHGENFLDSTGKVISIPDPNRPGFTIPIGSVGGDVLRGDHDFQQGFRFLSGRLSHQRRLTGLFSAEFLPNIFSDLRFSYINRNGGNNPISEFWAFLELRFGY